MSELRYEILFHFENVELVIQEPERHILWVESVISAESKIAGNLNFIFCTDKYLHQMNVDYLNHDTLTDVITFPLRYDRVEGDIFISKDRVAENAKTFDVEFDAELRRVMIHGVLHLVGFGDKTEEEIALMRSKEDFYLNSF